MTYFAADHATFGSRRRIQSRPEQDLQIAIFDFIRLSMTYNGRSLADYAFHVPNSAKRGLVEAQRNKRAGVKPGVNDIVVPIACGGYGGLWIELKVDKNDLTDNQINFHQRLREGGQQVHTCRTLTEVVAVICDYFRPSGLFVLRAKP